jgi:hypothetical protein
VNKLREYYEYGLEVESAFPELMARLCDGGVKLDSMQALAKQLAALLDFVIRFDHVKMNTPPIQNDFSYYRRSMQRMKVWRLALLLLVPSHSHAFRFQRFAIASRLPSRSQFSSGAQPGGRGSAGRRGGEPHVALLRLGHAGHVAAGGRRAKGRRQQHCHARGEKEEPCPKE